MSSEAQKAINVSDNLIRYSEQEALEGSYLNAILVLNQTAKDINRKLKQGILTGDQATPMLTKIGSMKNQYIS